MAKILRRGFDTERGADRVKKTSDLKPIAEELGCTQAQLALAWCAANKRVTTVITGASRPSQVRVVLCLSVRLSTLLWCGVH